jgi:hypothetical protein
MNEDIGESIAKNTNLEISYSNSGVIKTELPRTRKWRNNTSMSNIDRPTKKLKFTQPQNIETIYTRIYAKYIKSGGTNKPKQVVKLILDEIPKWLTDTNLDGYESLVHYDVDVEIESINNAFIKHFIDKYQSIFMDNEYRTITATHTFTVDDYRNFDAYKGKRTLIDNNAQNSHRRFRNTIPIYQTCNHARNHDRDNTEGLANRGSVETIDRGFNMNRISKIMDKDYTTIDTLDIDYYGVTKHDQYPYSV